MTLLDNTRSSFDRDVAWSAFAMVVPIGFGLMALPIILTNTGPQVFTLFLLSFGAINFAPSLDLGIARTAQRRIAYARALHRDDQHELARLALQWALVVSLVAAALTAFAATFLFPPQAGRPPFELAVVTGLGVGIAIYANTQRGILEGLGAFSRSALNRAGVGVMLVAAPVLMSFVMNDATALAMSALSIRLPFVWEQQRAVRAALSRQGGGPEPARENLTVGFIRESGWFALLSVLAVAMSGFDRYIMIAWGGLADQSLTVFLATQEMALRAIALPAALLPALMVRLAASQASAETGILSRRLFWALIPAAVLTCIWISWQSEAIADFLYPQLPAADTTAAIRILLVGIVASAIAQFPMARLLAAGRARDAAFMHLAEFVIYLALAPVLISSLGSAGAATLWTGRICIDAVLLLGWSATRHAERRFVGLETLTLIASVALVAFIGFNITP